MIKHGMQEPAQAHSFVYPHSLRKARDRDCSLIT